MNLKGLPQWGSLYRTHSGCPELDRSPLHTGPFTSIQTRCVCKEIHTPYYFKQYYFKAINLIVQNTIKGEKTIATFVFFWIKNFSLGKSCSVGDLAHCAKAKLWKVFVFLTLMSCSWIRTEESSNFWAPTVCQALYYMASHFLLKLLEGRYHYLIFTDSGKRLRNLNELAQSHTATNESTQADP